MVTISCIYSQLVDNLIFILTPIFYVHQCIMQRSAIFTLEIIPFTQQLRGSKYIRCYYFGFQPFKFIFSQPYSIKRLKLFSEVLFKRVSVANISAIGVFEFF